MVLSVGKAVKMLKSQFSEGGKTKTEKFRSYSMQNKFLWFFLFSVALTACRPDDTSDIGFVSPTELCLTIKHHADIVEDTEVYLKLNAEEFPGYNDLVYDTLIAEAPNAGRVCIEGIVYGKYWAMAKGYDADWGDDVQGAILLELNQFEPVVDTVLTVNEF